MKTTSRIVLASTLALVGAASGGCAASRNAGSPGVVSAQRSGIVTAAVVHAVTGQPLAKMPVTVRRVVPPEEGTPRVYWTGRSGTVVITGLQDGRYEAFVFFNNIRSESAWFSIVGDNHPPLVTISFNPDID